MSKKKGDEALPPEVQAQVDAAREEGEEPEQQAQPEAEPERVAVPGRRRQREVERQEELAAAAERAEKLETSLADLRRQREEDSRTLAEMRGMLTATVQSRTTSTNETPAAPELPGWYRKEIEDAEKDLSEGRVTKYHERIGTATLKLADERAQYHRSQNPAPQQRPEKPAWVSAIEGKYSDVVLHRAGIKTVLYHADLDERANGPEKLEAAYQAARKTLGLEKQAVDPAANQRQRQMLSGGSVNGGATGRGGSAKGSNEKFVNVPKNYKEIAARAGMTPEAYIKAYADMNPGEITN